MKLGFLGPRRKRAGGLLSRLAGGRFRSQWVKLPWTLAVASGKGGTGKSIFAVNLAVMLSQEGRKVGLFDADLGVANAHLLLGVQATRNVAMVLSGRSSLREASLASPYGPRLVAGGSGISDLANLSAHEILRLAGEFRPFEEGMDFLVLDCAAGISVQTVLFLQAADDILVVTNPDFTAMTDAYALVKVVLQRDPSARLHVIVNRVRAPAQGEEVFARLQGVCSRFLGKSLGYLGCVEEDEAVRRSVGERRPFVLGSPDSPAAVGLRAIRDRILALGNPPDQEASGCRPEGYGERLGRALRN